MSAAPVRSWEGLQRSLRNYDWLRDACPGATDIDFFIERNGYFLIGEFKPLLPHGVSIGWGQWKALRTLASREGFRVIVVGESSHGELAVAEVSGLKPGYDRAANAAVIPVSALRVVTRDELSDLVRGWFEWATAQSKAA